MPTLSPPPYQDAQGSLRWHAWYRQINNLLELTSLSIDNIDDVVISGVTDNEFLTWDTGTNKWINQTLTELGIVLDTTPQLGGSLDVNGNSIVSVSAGDIPITPDTTGNVILDGVNWPQADGAANEVLVTDGAAQTSWSKVGIANLDTDLGDMQLGWVSQTLDDIKVGVTESGGVLTFSLQKEATGDVRVIFSDGVHTHDCTPADTVTLTAGTDISPTFNYVYILQSDKLLTVSTTDWPAGEHCRIAEVVCQSAASLATDGPMHLHKITEATFENNSGQMGHFAEWIRQQPATWRTGVAPTVTIDTGPSPDTIDFDTTAGSVLQLHSTTYPAFDTATGSEIYIVNDNTAAFTKTSNIEVDAFELDDGTAKANGDYLTLVIWGVVSSETTDCKLFCNLPSAFYRTEANAVADVFNYANHSIPSDYENSGFLIARLTIKYNSAGGGQFTVPTGGTIDLRGTIPSTAVGGSASLAQTEFADNAFLLYDDADDTKQVAFQLSGLTTATTRTLTVPDASGTLALTSDFEANLGAGTTAVTASSHSHAVAERYLLCDTSSNAITVNLVAAATATAGYRLDIKVTDATNAVTIDGNSTETIDGSTTLVLSTLYDNASLVCDGSNWHIL